MARGYPDWFGQSIWPKYGTPLVIGNSAGTVAPQAVGIMMNLSGQGVLHQLRIAFISLADERSHILSIYVDGTLMIQTMITSELDTLDVYADPSIFPLVLYSLDTYTALWVLKREIPFKTSFEVTATNVNALGGNDLTTHGIGYYYRVT